MEYISFDTTTVASIDDLFNKLTYTNKEDDMSIIANIINICRNMISQHCDNKNDDEIRNSIIDNIIINIIKRYNAHNKLMDIILDGINNDLSYYQFYWHFVYRIDLSQYDLSNMSIKYIIQKIMDNSILPYIYDSTYTAHVTEILDDIIAIFGSKIDNIFNNDLPINPNILINNEPIFNVLTLAGKLTVLGCTEVLHMILMEIQISNEYAQDLIKCAERYNNNSDCHKYLVNLLYNMK